jgi:hypothetical protein
MSMYQKYYDQLIKSGADTRTASAMAGQYTARSMMLMQQRARYRSARRRGRNVFGRAQRVVSPGMSFLGEALGKVLPQNVQNTLTKQPTFLAQQEAAKEGIQKAGEEVRATQKQIGTEIAVQQQLKPIRRRRKSMLEQQVKSLRNQTGRRALLASPTGGAGFFGGYFKG